MGGEIVNFFELMNLIRWTFYWGEGLIPRGLGYRERYMHMYMYIYIYMASTCRNVYVYISSASV